MELIKISETDDKRVFTLRIDDSIIEELKLKGIDVLEEIKSAVRNYEHESDTNES